MKYKRNESRSFYYGKKNSFMKVVRMADDFKNAVEAHIQGNEAVGQSFSAKITPADYLAVMKLLYNAHRLIQEGGDPISQETANAMLAYADKMTELAGRVIPATGLREFMPAQMLTPSSIAVLSGNGANELAALCKTLQRQP